MDNTIKYMKYKPDINQAVQRWDAYFNGDIIDRPVVCVSAPKSGFENEKLKGNDYYSKIYGDIDKILDDAIEDAKKTYYGGELIPAFYPSIGPDEIACYCGADLKFGNESKYTNWSVPFIDDWLNRDMIKIDDNNFYWQRIQEIYRRAAMVLKDKMLIYHLDLHTNLDLLSAIRGPERLCMDLLDTPEIIDDILAEAREVFRKLWFEISEAGDMAQNGYWYGAYGETGVAMIQCDFCALIGPDMFDRWVMPQLEYEAEIVKRVIFHWDGPAALKHMNSLLASDKIHTLAYVPLPSEGGHINLISLLKEIQDAGKGVYVAGTPEEIKEMHKSLNPAKTIYNTSAKTQDEAEEILDWFIKNT